MAQLYFHGSQSPEYIIIVHHIVLSRIIIIIIHYHHNNFDTAINYSVHPKIFHVHYIFILTSSLFSNVDSGRTFGAANLLIRDLTSSLHSSVKPFVPTNSMHNGKQ